MWTTPQRLTAPPRKGWFNWRYPIAGAVGAVGLHLIDAAEGWNNDIGGPVEALVFSFALLSPIASLILLLVNKRRIALSLFFAAMSYIVFTMVWDRHEEAVAPYAIWLVRSDSLKGKVLSRIASKGEMPHADLYSVGLGLADSRETYVVYDPVNALASAARTRSPVLAAGVPCGVQRVRRLEDHWYSVQCYRNERW